MIAPLKTSLLTGAILAGLALSLGAAIYASSRSTQQVQRTVCSREVDALLVIGSAYLENLYETGERYAWKRHQQLIGHIERICGDSCGADVEEMVGRMRKMKEVTP